MTIQMIYADFLLKNLRVEKCPTSQVQLTHTFPAGRELKHPVYNRYFQKTRNASMIKFSYLNHDLMIITMVIFFLIISNGDKENENNTCVRV